jgi:serine/threonine protein kinase
MRAAFTRLAARLNAAIGTARDGGARRPPLAPGRELGPYCLVSPIFSGATSEVWVAKISGEHGFEKAIALKVLKPDPADETALVRAFTAEAAAAARLYHPNIVQLVDCGKVAGFLYTAMELIDGLTLRQVAVRLRELDRPLPVRLQVKIALQICAALHYAHELPLGDGWVGLLHRDLTPDNLMVSPRGEVKVIDFGAARLADDPAAAPTMGGQTAYLAPERVRGLAEDRRTDIYSLGVLLYEQATGRRPFEGDEATVAARIVEGCPPASVADLPEELARIVLKAMAREPDHRYATAELMANDLQVFAHHHNARVRYDPSQSIDTALRTIFAAGRGRPAVPGQVPQVLAAGMAGAGDPERERFAPDEDEANDEVTRPTALLPGDRATSNESADPPEADVLPELPAVFTDAALRVAAPPSSWFAFRRLTPPAPEIFSQANGAAAPDAFALRRQRADRDRAELLAPDPGPVDEHRRASHPEAADCFDRGLALVASKDYQLALPQWQRACDLDPENRTYQTNLKRLCAHIEQRQTHTREKE